MARRAKYKYESVFIQLGENLIKVRTEKKKERILLESDQQDLGQMP
jgi:hypothetical protein